MIGQLSCAELVDILQQNDEYALLDARDEALYANHHILQASSLPLQRAEIDLGHKLPRRDGRIILCDDDGASTSSAARLAERMQSWGYSKVSLLAGGLQEWMSHGLATYSGLNTLSKGFGEAVEQRWHTPHISAEKLASWMREGRRYVLLDCRPASEYQAGTLPHSKNLPGVELPYRIGALLPDAETPVVVHCAGRTRGIIAGQTLIDGGIRNPVHVLDGGLMGWMLAGRSSVKPEPDDCMPTSGLVSASGSRSGAGLDFDSLTENRVNRAYVDRWLQERGDRTTYLMDVRTLGEYTEGHDSRAVHAPGGQLLQATDVYLPVRNAKVIVADDDGIRSRIVAHWLRAMGWADVVSWPMFEDDVTLVKSPPLRSFALARSSHVRWVDVEGAIRLITESGAEMLDLDTSSEYEKGHIPGSQFIKRGSLAGHLSRNAGKPVILVSSDGMLARIAAADHSDIREVFVLAGGKTVWRASHKSIVAGEGTKLDPPDDVWRRPIEAPGDLRKNMQSYLDWEVGLTAKLLADPSVRFQLRED